MQQPPPQPRAPQHQPPGSEMGSGPTEFTALHCLFISYNEFKSIFISAKDKREIQKIFRRIGKPRIFVYRLFSILIFLLVKNHLKKIDQIIIDEEYPGKMSLIKNFLLQEIRKINREFQKNNIVFKTLGKKSRAHFLAYGVAIGKKKADMEVTAKDILKIMVK
jgi:nucleoside-triphosphatase THEP1